MKRIVSVVAAMAIAGGSAMAIPAPAQAAGPAWSNWQAISTDACTIKWYSILDDKNHKILVKTKLMQRKVYGKYIYQRKVVTSWNNSDIDDSRAAFNVYNVYIGRTYHKKYATGRPLSIAEQRYVRLNHVNSVEMQLTNVKNGVRVSSSAMAGLQWGPLTSPYSIKKCYNTVKADGVFARSPGGPR